MDTIEVILTPDQRERLQPLADHLVRMVETEDKSGMILAQVWVSSKKIPHRIQAGYVEEPYAQQLADILEAMNQHNREVIGDDREADSKDVVEESGREASQGI